MERINNLTVALKISFNQEVIWGEFVGINEDNEIVIASKGQLLRVQPEQIKDEIIHESPKPAA